MNRPASTWQQKLTEECQIQNKPKPVWNIISDRRGGRTAWSSTVTIGPQSIAARYWYDGQYLNNAKEDCSEVACMRLRAPSMTTTGGGAPVFMNLSAASEESDTQVPESSDEEHLKGKIENWAGPSPESMAKERAAAQFS